MNNIDFIYFDLGNVILDFDHRLACKQIGSLSNLSADEVWETLFVSGQVEQYDQGTISTKDFYSNFCRARSVEVEIEKFLNGFSDIFSIHQPIIPLVLELKQQHVPLGILSNTCPAHWAFVINRYPVISQLFDSFVLSYEERSNKPAPKIYEAAARKANTPSSRIFFMDDRAENVQGALTAGLDAVLYRNSIELREQLLERGFRV